MLISRYAQAVEDSDQFKDRPPEERQRIAIYGLVSEIGSVISAVKKQDLGEGGSRDTTEGVLTRHDLQEELGDVMWYCFALARTEEGHADNILARQFDHLLQQLSGDDDNAELFRETLKRDNDGKRLNEFRQQAEVFLTKSHPTLCDFQNVAYKTARTDSDTLVEVCLTVLTQFSAQLMRPLLPASEQQLHDQLKGRPRLEILGEIAWHIAAIASVYALKLDDVAQTNIKKVNARRASDKPTLLHDSDRPHSQQFPRRFEVKFLTIGKGRSRMYLDGVQLGDDLTDNAREPDGYRFHDVLHLANVAHLGWSPVIRALMKRKRKDEIDTTLDEVEDGARAIIIEEAVVKFMHSEGADIANIVHPNIELEKRPIFSNDVDIPLSFFSSLRRLVRGLEVEKNSFLEWKSAMRDGFKIYGQLVEHQQGTVTVNLDARSISFRPEVYVDLAGSVVGLGAHAVSLSSFNMPSQTSPIDVLTRKELAEISASDPIAMASHVAAKHAILQSLGFDSPEPEQFEALSLAAVASGKYSVKASAELQEKIWQGDIITFKTAVSHTQSSLYCTALAMSDAAGD